MQQKIRFQIEGMTCQACASRIEKVLNKKDFVESAGVNFASEEAQVTFDGSKTSVADIAKIIEKTGYGAKEKTEDTLPQPEAEHHIGWRLWLLLTINIPFLIGMVGMMLKGLNWTRHDWMIPPVWQFVLASIVQLWLAIPFYKSAWASIKGGLANMDVLVTIGTVSIYLYSVYMLFFSSHAAHGMATPAAIMVGMGKAVKHGIWFKDAAAMEEAAHVDAVVLDKTGTLTEGRPQVAAVYYVPDSGFDEDALYRIAAAVEQNAAHPLARAIVSAAQARGLEIPAAQNAQTVVGAGITAEVEGVGLVKSGKAEFAELTLPKFSDGVWEIASAVTVSVNGKPIGAFALSDALKADTAEAIGRLKKHNIDVYIMSGDNQSTVEYVAKQLGIAHAFGNMSPCDKAAEVQKLKAAGKTVAMVGDGINDAPALAAANVSFAMKGGADVAEHTASATLMQHSVNQLADALLISQATLKNIKQNLFFAFFYNILGIPLAALGFLNPVIAGAAMAASSVSVLGNALRLK
ncbi:TPA: heavy metal translocating P-type ATPase [Neisseria gonorrhoeae]